MNDQAGDKKHTDKFGYASVQVGDSAALFSKHFERYGPHYGIAAQNMGAALGVDGSATQTLLAGQRFFSLATPLLGVGALLNTAATTLQAAAQLQHTRQLARSMDEQMALRQADHLWNQTQKDSLSAIVETAQLYAREESATRIHLVVADTFLAAQLRLDLERMFGATNNGKHIRVFDTLQEALDEITPQTDGNPTKALIYFHSLQPVCVHQDLRIGNRQDFCLRSDAGQGGLEPRLVLKGKLTITNSTGALRAVAICGGFDKDANSQIKFVKCTTTPQGAVSFTDPEIQQQSWQKQRRTLSLLVVAPVLAALAASMMMPPKASK